MAIFFAPLSCTPKRLPFKVKAMIGDRFVVDLQVGDTVQFFKGLCFITQRPYCKFISAIVNGMECLVSYSDLSWIYNYFANRDKFPKDSVNRKFFNCDGKIDIEFLVKHRFKIVSLFNVEAYVFELGEPKFVETLVDGKVVFSRATMIIQKPLFEIC